MWTEAVTTCIEFSLVDPDKITEYGIERATVLKIAALAPVEAGTGGSVLIAIQESSAGRRTRALDRQLIDLCHTRSARRALEKKATETGYLIFAFCSRCGGKLHNICCERCGRNFSAPEHKRPYKNSGGINLPPKVADYAINRLKHRFDEAPPRP